MKMKFLLPHCCLQIGWILFGLALLLHGVFLCDLEPKILNLPVFAAFGDQLFTREWFVVIRNNILDELTIITTIVSLLFLAFSRRKNEDEYIQKLRMESLMWATYLNFFLIIFCTVFVYGTAYLTVVFYGMFSILLLFVLRFNFVLYRIKR